MRCTVLPVVLMLSAALASGCGERTDEAALPLTSAQRAVFLATGTPGPDAPVLVVATVPQARAAGGAIVLTGGQELEVVEPRAWRRATGTALAVEEADRQLLRMHALDQALCALAGSTAALIQQLQAPPLPRPAPAPRPALRTPHAPSAVSPAVQPAPPPDLGATSRAERRDADRARQSLALAEAADRHAAALDAADERTLANLLETQAMTRAAASGKPIDYQLALSQAQGRDWAQLRARHDARLAQLRAQLVRDLAQLAQPPVAVPAQLAVAPRSRPDPTTRSEERHAPAN